MKKQKFTVQYFVMVPREVDIVATSYSEAADLAIDLEQEEVLYDNVIVTNKKTKTQKIFNEDTEDTDYDYE